MIDEDESNQYAIKARFYSCGEISVGWKADEPLVCTMELMNVA